jgi:hypothetical protein
MFQYRFDGLPVNPKWFMSVYDACEAALNERKAMPYYHGWFIIIPANH